MANQEHLAKLTAGVGAWNEWRVRNSIERPDLSGAELPRIDLGQAQLTMANLADADLTDSHLVETILQNAQLRAANLSGADLRGAELRGANLYLANLANANLNKANLAGANLRSATLLSTNFDRANLHRVKLDKAILGWTDFSDTNLSGAEGMESCLHNGPSSLGIDTFFHSKGDLPDVFLRGCGVPDQFITYARSLIGKPIEFYSCFISYSTEDQEFARRLYADLQNNAVRCWFAPHDLAGGKKVHEQIDEAIRVYDRLLLILSEHSMKSAWVETEISKARKRELREGRRILFPVRLVEFGTLRDWECFDADTGKDSAREIREYFIPDFSKWKDHDEYKKAFDRLLRDLKTGAGAPA